MREILILSPYPLFPILVAFVVKGLNAAKQLTYLITLVIFIAFPLVVTHIDDYNSLQASGPQHNDAQQFYLIASYIFLLPLALIIQFIVNWIWFRKVI